MSETSRKMTKQEGIQAIAEQKRIANEALNKAVAIADELSIDFHWDGPTYGMGGYYQPESWNSSDCWGDDEGGWMSSSQSC